MMLSRWKIVSSFLLLFAIHSQSQHFRCPRVEEPEECPEDPDPHACHFTGEYGEDNCDEGIMCCKDGCGGVHCVVPEVAPTQPQKIKTTKVTGPKNISDLGCPQVMEPEECPAEPEEWRCLYEGKSGKAGHCEEDRICCNIGCGMLDCVVPEVAPTQPRKVKTTKVTGPKNISDLKCPQVVEPEECPSEPEEWRCLYEGKSGKAGLCEEDRICCNIGCSMLDCVVPEVAPTQPHKVRTTKVTGQKKISVPDVAPTQPQKVTTTEDSENKNITGFICPSFEEPAECPLDDDEDNLCQAEGKIGSDVGCPPGLICCNTGCQFLDCVVPEVTPTPTQPQKVPVCEKLQNAFQNLKRQLDEIQKELKNLPKDDVDRRKDSSLPKNCAELYKSGETISGVYTIDPDGSGTFDVYCDQKTAGGGWTVFQKRLDGSVDFYRGWKEYNNGFGNQNGEFWLGLDKIHRLTISYRYKLRVDLEDTEGDIRYAEYDLFAVASESTGYQLILGSYSGTAGNSLTRHRGKAFSTPDRDNDRYWPHNCASLYKGAWWFDDCLDSNLNGPYHGKHQFYSEGIYWYHWQGKDFSAKRTEMKIKPVNA